MRSSYWHKSNSLLPDNCQRDFVSIPKAGQLYCWNKAPSELWLAHSACYLSSLGKV